MKPSGLEAARRPRTGSIPLTVSPLSRTSKSRSSARQWGHGPPIPSTRTRLRPGAPTSLPPHRSLSPIRYVCCHVSPYLNCTSNSALRMQLGHEAWPLTTLNAPTGPPSPTECARDLCGEPQPILNLLRPHDRVRAPDREPLAPRLDVEPVGEHEALQAGADGRTEEPPDRRLVPAQPDRGRELGVVLEVEVLAAHRCRQLVDEAFRRKQEGRERAPLRAERHHGLRARALPGPDRVVEDGRFPPVEPPREGEG